MFPYRIVSVTPELPELINRLRDIAYDFWFSWNPAGIEFFRSINPELWREVEHNPVKFLMRVRKEDLERAAQDEDYLALYKRVFDLYDRYMSQETWFAKKYPEHKGDLIAYFSAEFGLHESHPIYSGGLGLLAGDHCKSASDLGLPFIGVGLLYKQGYFHQRINSAGKQEAEYPHLNFYELPITPVNNSDGSQLDVTVELDGRTVFVQVWKVKVGRITVYLLDTDTSKNAPQDRNLTGQLYGGDREYRLSQEIVLGVGGVRALRAMKINPGAWHINEGHAAFLIIERIRELMRYMVSFETAREVVRASTIFTTHTPVPAGHDLFTEELIIKYFNQIVSEMGINIKSLEDLAWDVDRNSFNMTLLALRHAFLANGVSRLHGKVSRRMFQSEYSSLHPEEIPVTSVTNGVHVETWLAVELKELLARYIGKKWFERIAEGEMWEKVDQIPDQELWRVHRQLKEKMISFARLNLKQQRRRNREPVQNILEIDEYLDPDILTIGFARRFATYKRAALLFRTPERLERLLNNNERPVRFVFAGKAHPADTLGQELIKKIYDYSHKPGFRGRIVLLENYDIHLARHLVHGVDVWLNTPRRPMEASGTSGLKASLNGLINVSTLDGWWPEAYDGKNGFVVGSDSTYLNEEVQDQDDCFSLYSVLEDKVIPMYYRREDGFSPEWVRMMKETIKTIAPVFNTGRMVAEYTDRFYIPAINRGKMFAANDNYLGNHAGNFKKLILDYWDQVSFVSVESSGRTKMLAGEEIKITAVVNLGLIYTRSVILEIVYGEAVEGELRNINVVPMALEGEIAENIYRYNGSLTLPQGSYGYTVRVRPDSRDFPHTELPLVTWAPVF
ncbi:alpha-glucan family phosphorylase [Pelotomaculum propionicicum]|uniref:alpha-glucan family phosphorylase n=1 Tax=Pelotomaculum propionicicum TaxID=258475 RepID=UPI003B760A5D